MREELNEPRPDDLSSRTMPTSRIGEYKTCDGIKGKNTKKYSIFFRNSLRLRFKKHIRTDEERNINASRINHNHVKTKEMKAKVKAEPHKSTKNSY